MGSKVWEAGGKDSWQVHALEAFGSTSVAQAILQHQNTDGTTSSCQIVHKLIHRNWASNYLNVL